MCFSTATDGSTIFHGQPYRTIQSFACLSLRETREDSRQKPEVLCDVQVCRDHLEAGKYIFLQDSIIEQDNTAWWWRPECW